MNPDEMVWEDPPRGGSDMSKLGRWHPFVAELRKHPGKWARATANKTYIEGALRARLKAQGCEVVSRTQPDGTFSMYARWPEDAS